MTVMSQNGCVSISMQLTNGSRLWSHDADGCSFTTSAANGPPFFEENGRQYGTFRQGRYFLPIDEVCGDEPRLRVTADDIRASQEEKERLDCFHAVIFAARGHRHWSSEMPEGARVLDLGTGTGIWAIDASEYDFRSRSQSSHLTGTTVPSGKARRTMARFSAWIFPISSRQCKWSESLFNHMSSLATDE